ncbi:MAG TPA: tRNA pseudouridine(55) synthase TruB [Chitinophagales bacterium]|nr:tRNA pseudouridine(55) synthase TruB [Chitinophagales bacterium]
MTTHTTYNFSEGEIILIDKPLDWTSFDVVNKIKFALKKQYGKIKIGHAGTLDPKATGLLILCTGKKTKEIESIQNADKEYTGTFFLGATTECFDTEKDVNQTFDISGISIDAIKKCAENFIGEQEQFPPIHSAVKIDGKRAYELARAGKEVAVKSKIITIKKFDITNIHLPLIDFHIKCTKGTYIRSLANDFGKLLNNGAYLHALRRTKIGDYGIEDAQTVEEFLKCIV